MKGYERFYQLQAVFPLNRQPVNSVGRASDYRAGGRGLEPQTGPTLRVLIKITEENLLPLLSISANG